ncbi:MAG: hypothetical protein HY903_03225 [Deltaproteobacteria bacterium]|nr:hypothetical protein [Deltaproteobacteria bacterium]
MSAMETIPNVVAAITSLAAIVALAIMAPKLGGQIGLTIKLIVVGVFFSVFLHAGVELAATTGILGEQALMVVMGLLLSLGSVAFFAAGIIGLRALR